MVAFLDTLTDVQLFELILAFIVGGMLVLHYFFGEKLDGKHYDL